MIENVYKTTWNNNIAITISFNNAVRYKKLARVLYLRQEEKREGISYK